MGGREGGREEEERSVLQLPIPCYLHHFFLSVDQSASRLVGHLMKDQSLYFLLCLHRIV